LTRIKAKEERAMRKKRSQTQHATVKNKDRDRISKEKITTIRT
jgi:hypothetical protein